MICRARPKYLRREDFTDLYKNQKDHSFEDGKYYFNSGRASLKFLLIVLKELWSKNELIVGLTSFNCVSSMEAILDAQCRALLIDIKPNDFSLSLNSLKSQSVIPDVLVLVHYQGIPNQEYLEIASYCRDKNIFLVDDLSHNYGSKFKGISLGTLSNASLYSFAFDKPLTGFSGGALSINLKEKDLYLSKVIARDYKTLPFESQWSTSTDLQKLRLLFEVTSQDNYIRGVDKPHQLWLLNLLGLNILVILKFYRISSLFRFFFRAIGLIFKFIKSKEIKIEKMRVEKIQLIKMQQERYEYDENKAFQIQRILKEIGLEAYSSANAEIHWNRLSVLDPDDKFRNFLKLKNIQIEASNYNWPETLELIFRNHNDVIVEHELPNSEYAAKNIVNIPIWSENT